MGQQDHHINPLETSDCRDSRTSCVSRCSYQHRHVSLCAAQEIVVQLPNNSKGKVFEGEGRAVVQLRDVEAISQAGNGDGFVSTFKLGKSILQKTF